jgi:hypothetical protein
MRCRVTNAVCTNKYSLSRCRKGTVGSNEEASDVVKRRLVMDDDKTNMLILTNVLAVVAEAR